MPVGRANMTACVCGGESCSKCGPVIRFEKAKISCAFCGYVITKFEEHIINEKTFDMFVHKNCYIKKFGSLIQPAEEDYRFMTEKGRAESIQEMKQLLR